MNPFDIKVQSYLIHYSTPKIQKFHVFSLNTVISCIHLSEKKIKTIDELSNGKFVKTYTTSEFIEFYKELIFFDKLKW
jgi:hypothetical protein